MDGRIRLRQWLEGRLNTGYIPGLVWLDKSKGIFKIPWKHHSKHTWQEDDAAIFKDWAVVTGRYREGLDVPDWPMWKTRLRCALNKAPDIQEVRQHHNLHCDEPFKVYRFISKTESMWRANATRHASLIFDGVPSVTGGIQSQHQTPQQQQHQLINSNIPQFFHANSSQCLIRSANNHKKISLSKPITLIQKTEQGHIKLKYINIPIHKSSLSLISNSSSSSPPPVAAPHQHPPPQSQHHSGCQDHHQKQLQFSSPIKTSSSLSIINCNNNNSTNNKTTSNNNPSGIGGGGGGGGGGVHGMMENSKIKLTDVMEPEMHQICLRIQHLDHRVSDMIVNNPNGCCIYFGRFDENLSTAGPEPIEPQIYQYVSDSNKYCVDMLLENMQRGVVLTILNGSIYAEKLCKCATFVYRPGNNGEFYFVDKLNRRDKMMIFDFRSFLEELHYFQRGLGNKPHVELILAFGQQIKDNSSPESLYVWCRLASCKAWFLLQRALSNQSKSTVISSSNNNNNSNSNSNNNNIINNNNSGINKKLCPNNVNKDQHHHNHHHLHHHHHHIIKIETAKLGDSLSHISSSNGLDHHQSEEVVVVPEDLIEENVIDHMVYGENCLSDDLGIGVGQEVSIENVSEEFTTSISFQSNFGSRSRFEENDLNYQFENSSNYEFK